MLLSYRLRSAILSQLEEQQAAEKTSSDRHVRCPVCNHRQHYKLSDGRRKCKRCGKKFTSRLKYRLNVLSVEVRNEIARLFWLGVPSVRVARDIGIHRNTAYRYYKRIREWIAADREVELSKLDGSVEADESYC